MKPATPVLIAALTLAALPALAGDDCDVPLDRWQPREAVQQMATRQGWKLQRLKIDDGCYELRATDAQGRRIKAKVDPETLQIIQVKHKDRKRDRAQDRDHGGAAPSASGAGGAAPTPLFTPGATPRAQID
ncbi:MAG: hypothetical protein BGO13_07980 [Burkholderiales bacterium 66-5]|nr:MAG: hypothetical protein BGO13_07980 [Burkholderiales bacterium 66-5]